MQREEVGVTVCVQHSSITFLHVVAEFEDEAMFIFWDGPGYRD